MQKKWEWESCCETSQSIFHGNAERNDGGGRAETVGMKCVITWSRTIASSSKQLEVFSLIMGKEEWDGD